MAVRAAPDAAAAAPSGSSRSATSSSSPSAAIWVALLGIHEKDELPKELGVDTSHAALAATAVLVCVVAPVAEEFIFRGYFFPALRNWKGLWPAVVLDGLIFGAIHAGSAPVGYLVPLALFGSVLCLVYARTGSLYPCIALHALNNSIAFGAGVGWGWQVPLVFARRRRRDRRRGAGRAAYLRARAAVPFARLTAPGRADERLGRARARPGSG